MRFRTIVAIFIAVLAFAGTAKGQDYTNEDLQCGIGFSSATSGLPKLNLVPRSLGGNQAAEKLSFAWRGNYNFGLVCGEKHGNTGEIAVFKKKTTWGRVYGAEYGRFHPLKRGKLGDLGLTAFGGIGKYDAHSISQSIALTGRFELTSNFHFSEGMFQAGGGMELEYSHGTLPLGGYVRIGVVAPW